MHPNRTELWHLARHLLTTMLLALGAPAAIADRATLTRPAKREIMAWLAPLECLVRKMLLIEAAALPRPAERPHAPRRISKAMIAAWTKKRARKTHVADPARPASWRVTFHLKIPRDPLDRKAPPDRTGPRMRPLQTVLVRDIWSDRAQVGRERDNARRAEARKQAISRKLAERYEAVRRVIENPLPHAERLARILWRKRGAAAWAARRIAQTRLPRRDPLFDDVAPIITPRAFAIIPRFRLCAPSHSTDTS